MSEKSYKICQYKSDVCYSTEAWEMELLLHKKVWNIHSAFRITFIMEDDINWNLRKYAISIIISPLNKQEIK